MQHAYMDKYTQLDSPIHRLDARAKILAVLIYIATVISIPRTEILSLVPFAIYPVILVTIAGIPLRALLKHAVIVSPFILSLAIFAPVFDQTPVGEIGGWTVTAGWLACGNLIIKFFLTVLATLSLAATTRFDRLLLGLERLGMPRAMVMQLSFLYRYLFLLVEEAFQMKQARDARNFHRAPFKRRWMAVRGIIAVLFIKTLARAERVYAAMVARGFTGSIRSFYKPKLRIIDWAFTACSLIFAGLARWAPWA
jgi:cobalt/nickel transport system permease protein